jgi:tetratricopeptide (TPR) repeat protein
LAVVALRNTGDAATQKRLLYASGGLLGYAIIQFFDFPRERIDMQVYWAVLLALSLHTCRHTRVLSAVWKPTAGIRLLLLTLAGAGLLFNVLIGLERIGSEKHYVKAFHAQAKGKWAEVEKEALLAENPWNMYNEVVLPMAWYAGHAAYRSNRPADAVTHLERAYRLNPWSFQVLNNYASALLTQKQHQEAIPLLEQAVNINPRYDEGKFNLAYAWAQLGKLDSADYWLNRIDTIPNPTTPDEVQKNAKTLKNLEIFKGDIARRKSNQPTLAN